MKVIVLDACESTHDEALMHGERGAAHGTAIMAISQSAGRGRMGREWVSPAGKGLYCSIIIRSMLSIEDYPRLIFAAGLASANTIEECCRLSPGLKWPNDIYFRSRKCGGILAEAANLSVPSGDHFAVIGIGINVNTRQDEFPPAVTGKATSLFIEAERQFNVQELFAVLHHKVLGEVSRLEQHGFGQLIERWRRYDFMKGQKMTWLSVGREQVTGVSLGPDDRGILHVQDDYGEIHQVLSGDIELGVQK